MEKLRKIAFEKRLEKKTTILAIKNNGLIKKIEKLNALLVDKTIKLGQTKEGLRKQKLQLDVNFLTEKINGLRRRVLENNNSILQLNTTKKGFKEVEKSKTKMSYGSSIWVKFHQNLSYSILFPETKGEVLS